MAAGSCHIRWNSFRKAIICLWHKLRLIRHYLRDPVEITKGALCQYNHNSSLPLLIGITRNAECAQPVDKVYGMLGLISQNLARRIRLNYSCTPDFVFKHILLEYIVHSKRIELLGACRGPNVHKIPSWIPDFAAAPECTPWYCKAEYASGYSADQTKYIAPATLEITGVRTGTICTAVEDDKMRFVIYPPTGEPLLDAYAWTISFACILEYLPIGNYFALQQFKDLLGREIDFINNSHMPYILDQAKGRRFLTTKEGHIGYGPSSSLPDDIICTFLGAHTPTVLRAVAGSNSEFIILGECWFHGMMEAQPFLGALSEPWVYQPVCVLILIDESNQII